MWSGGGSARSILGNDSICSSVAYYLRRWSGHMAECGGCGLMVGVPGAYWAMIQYVPVWHIM